MTVTKLLFLHNTRQPDAYDTETKTGWINELEASLWGDILCMPPEMRPALNHLTDGQKRLLLPDGWEKIYFAYLAAMAQFTNGEYSRYENTMALYNGFIAELGAWYASIYTPANCPAIWAEIGTLAYNDDEVSISYPSLTGAVTAIECRVTTAFDGGGSIKLGTASEADKWMGAAEITPSAAGTYLRTGLVLPNRAETLKAVYTGENATAGQCVFRALIQPQTVR